MLCLPLLFASCFEEPVAESILIEFLPGQVAKLSVRVKIHEPDPAPDRLKRRLEETRRALLAGEDAWSARFAALSPAAERFTWEKRLGELDSVTHAALLEPQDSLERFFADTALDVTVRSEEGRTELSIVPGPPARASAREAADVERALTRWSEAIAEYLKNTAELYAYLDRSPDRAHACLGHLLREDLDEAQEAALPAKTPEEDRLIDTARESLRGVALVLLVEDGEERSLDELSHRVYDPFPARLSVRVPGPIVEIEGWTGGQVGDPPGGLLRARGVGFWDALQALRGRWLAPDPLLLHVAHQRAADAPFDLEAVLATPRRITVVSAAQVRATLLAGLRPEPAYRVVWSTAGLQEESPGALRKAWGDVH